MKEITLIKQAEINCKLHNILENETVFLNKEKTSLPFFNLNSKTVQIKGTMIYPIELKLEFTDDLIYLK